MTRLEKIESFHEKEKKNNELYNKALFREQSNRFRIIKYH